MKKCGKCGIEYEGDLHECSKGGNAPENGEEIHTVEESVSDIAESLLENTPGVSEHVIEQENQKTAETENGAKSPSGETFDPLQHVAPDKVNADGTFRKKPGRKKSNQSITGEHTKVAPKSQLGVFGTPSAPQVAQGPDPGTVAAAVAAANLTFQLGLIIGGDEWQPVIHEAHGIHEPAMMEKAWLDYFKARSVTDFPPGVALSIALGAYALPRFSRPKTQSRIKRFTGWIKAKFAKKKPAPKLDEKKEG